MLCSTNWQRLIQNQRNKLNICFEKIKSAFNFGFFQLKADFFCPLGYLLAALFCRSRSARVIAVMASITGTILGQRQTSCRPAITRSVSLKFPFSSTLIVFCSRKMLGTGLTAPLKKMSFPFEIPPFRQPSVYRNSSSCPRL